MNYTKEIDILKKAEVDTEEFCKAYDKAVNALELIGHLVDRPCPACEFKINGHCTKWNCIYDGMIYGRKVDI